MTLHNTEFWLLDQNCPVRGWQHSAVLAFTDGCVDGLGPRHYSRGTYSFDRDIFTADSNIFDRSGLDGAPPSEIGPQPVRASMFRNAPNEFSMHASGIRPSDDLIVGDVWIGHKPDARYLFRMSLISRRSLPFRGEDRCRRSMLDRCSDVARGVCTGMFLNIPLDSLRHVRSAYDGARQAA